MIAIPFSMLCAAPDHDDGVVNHDADGEDDSEQSQRLTVNPMAAIAANAQRSSLAPWLPDQHGTSPEEDRIREDQDRGFEQSLVDLVDRLVTNRVVSNGTS